MFQQRGGSGFLGSALTTAAGVAGGMVAGNALMSLFSGRGNEFGGGGGFGGAPAASPWTTPAAPGQDYVDSGTWGQGDNAPPAGNQDYVDNSSWDQSSSAPDSSWSDNSGSDDSSWDSGGGGGSDDTF
jgi:hypothetical protein